MATPIFSHRDNGAAHFDAWCTGTTAVLSVAGSLTRSLDPRLAELLDWLVARGVDLVTINVNMTTDIDSTYLIVLRAARERLHRRGESC